MYALLRKTGTGLKTHTSIMLREYGRCSYQSEIEGKSHVLGDYNTAIFFERAPLLESRAWKKDRAITCLHSSFIVLCEACIKQSNESSNEGWDEFSSIR